MFIETVPNRNSPPAVLLRESYRDDTGRSQKRTLANLSKLSAEVVAGLKALLAGGTVVGQDGLKVERSLPHGHVAATLGTVRKLALDRLMLSTAKDADSRRHRDLVVGLIVDRLVTPRSKLGFCARGHSRDGMHQPGRGAGAGDRGGARGLRGARLAGRSATADRGRLGATPRCPSTCRLLHPTASTATRSGRNLHRPTPPPRRVHPVRRVRSTEPARPLRARKL